MFEVEALFACHRIKRACRVFKPMDAPVHLIGKPARLAESVFVGEYGKNLTLPCRNTDQDSLFS